LLFHGRNLAALGRFVLQRRRRLFSPAFNSILGGVDGKQNTFFERVEKTGGGRGGWEDIQ
jgi:hypothetical protein